MKKVLLLLLLIISFTSVMGQGAHKNGVMIL
jgi:hypothetical protein